MSNRRSKPLLAILVIITSAFLLVTALLVKGIAAEEPKSSSFGNVVTPQPEKPVTALNCVEPVEVMRRDHMKFLLHQRDKTVIEGIRSLKYSLTGCIDCHAQPAESGEVIRSDNPEYFCTGCHLYTSVKIDCFECHADRPVSSFSQSSLNSDSHTVLAQFNPSRLDSSKLKRFRHKLQKQVTSSED
jgi:hypothetical protein